MTIRMLLAGLSCLPMMAAAEDFDYTYLEVGYVSTEIDLGPLDVDGDGLGVRGSYGFGNDLYAFVGLADQEFDFDVDGTQLSFGMGWHHGLNEMADLLAEVSYVSVDLESPFSAADEDGFGLGLGLRGRVWENIELEAGIDYVDLDDSDTSLSFDGRYYFNETVAVGGGLSFSDDATGWTLGVRAEF